MVAELESFPGSDKILAGFEGDKADIGVQGVFPSVFTMIERGGKEDFVDQLSHGGADR